MAAFGQEGLLLVIGFVCAPAYAFEPCCGIVGIDANGMVTAKDTASGRVFQFKVTNRALLQSLHVGQAIRADFRTNKVTVNGISPCCGIVAGAAASGAVAAAATKSGRRVAAHSAPSRAVVPSDRPAAAASAPTRTIAPCCNIVRNPALTGRLGRLVVTFPKAANASGNLVRVFKANDHQKDIADGYGNQAIELLPGTYAVAVNNKRVERVTIRSRHDTRVKVGILRITAGNGTNIRVLDSDQKTELTNTYGKQELGFPVGTVYVIVAGQSEAVSIAEGKITKF